RTKSLKCELVHTAVGQLPFAPLTRGFLFCGPCSLRPPRDCFVHPGQHARRLSVDFRPRNQTTGGLVCLRSVAPEGTLGFPALLHSLRGHSGFSLSLILFQSDTVVRGP